MLFLYLFCVLITGVVGPHPHHHELVCYGHQCHHDQACLIKQLSSGGAYTGTCQDIHHHCHTLCGLPTVGHDCCCKDQNCISEVNRVQCYSCPDILNCNLTPLRCQVGEECMYRRQNGVVSTRCATKDICNHYKVDDAHHGSHTTCCTDNGCVNSRLHHYTTTAIVGSTICPTCHDVITNQCTSNHTCHSDEVCMIGHVSDRVQTRCTKSVECQHHHVEGLTHPSRFTLCCEHSNCIQNAISQAKHVNPVTTTASTGNVCADVEDATFQCAEYVTNFDICNQLSGLGLKLASSRCQKTCGLCSGGKVQVTTQTHKPIVTTHENPLTSSPSTAAPTIVTEGKTEVATQTQKPIANTDASSMLPSPTKATPMGLVNNVTGDGLIQVTAQTEQPTVDIQDNSTAVNITTPDTIVQTGSSVNGTGNLPPCVDSDVTGMCKSYAFHICSAQPGPTKDFAVSSCAKTCNFCDEYHALLSAGASSPLIG